jgi:DNA replication protein DnaC
VGKTFIACALGHQAARDGFSVLYRRLPRLLDDLAIARVAGRHRSAFAKLARTRLLIIDDWMMTRLTAEQRRDLMEVIDDRHDRAATILASQIPVSGWFDQIGDATYADALLDRIVHNAMVSGGRGSVKCGARAPPPPAASHLTDPRPPDRRSAIEDKGEKCSCLSLAMDLEHATGVR